MRIVFDPEQMVRTARLMGEAAGDYSSRSARLAAGDRPAMPPDIAARIDEGLRSACGALDDTALRLETEGLMLRIRASLVAGDAGALSLATLNGFATLG